MMGTMASEVPSREACPKTLQRWVERNCGVPGDAVLSVSTPRAMAGQNRIWFMAMASGLELVLRCRNQEKAAEARCGMEIRKRLLSAGIAVPRSLAHSDGIDAGWAGFAFCELMSRVPGDDLELLWRQLSPTEASGIAIKAAEVVRASCRLFSPERALLSQGFGFCTLGNSGPFGSWGEFCADWIDWVGRRGGVKRRPDPRPGETHRCPARRHRDRHAGN